MCPTLSLSLSHLHTPPTSPPMASLLSLTPGSNPTRQRAQLATLFLSSRFLSHGAHLDLGQGQPELASSQCRAMKTPCRSSQPCAASRAKSAHDLPKIVLVLSAVTAHMDVCHVPIP